MTSTDKPVAIIMGSQSDWPTMKHAAEILDELGVGHEALIVSAHRTPDRLYDFAKSARQNGFKVIIAGAGGAAHLPGMTASLTSLPVFGVPMHTSALEGKDSLLSILQMPPGVPVGTLAIGKAGAINAALLACAVLALADPALAGRLDAWRARQTAARLRPGRAIDWPGCCGRTRPSGFWAAGSSAACWRWPPRALDFKCHVFCPEPASPAFDVVRRVTEADYGDIAALARFADDVDVITYEFENVPADAAAFLCRAKTGAAGSARTRDHAGPSGREGVHRVARDPDRALCSCCVSRGDHVRSQAGRPTRRAQDPAFRL